MMINKKVLNYSLFVSGFTTCLSGVVMQIGYHIGVADRTTVFYKPIWGMIYPEWQLCHQVVATVFFILCAIHIYRHRKWYKGVIERRIFKRNREVLIFSALFAVSAILGFLPWIINNGETQMLRHTLIEIHDKVSVVLIIFIVLHVMKRWKRIHQKQRTTIKTGLV